MDKINFASEVKMHKACAVDNLRPILQYIYFKNGYAYATNGCVLVRNKLSEICDAENLELLDEKLLHKDAYADILDYNVIKIKEDGIKCHKGEKRAFFYFYTGDGKYVNAERVLQNALNLESVPVANIGLNQNYIKLLNEALYDSERCEFIFKGQGEAVILKNIDSYNESLGLIMPMLLP